MGIPSFYPYRSADAKQRYLALYHATAKEWPIPEKSKLVGTSWGETFVRIGGAIDAPPLVLLPGHSSSSLLWSPHIVAFSERYRTYALDRNGDIGRSTCTRLMKTAEDLMDWLNQVFAALAPRTPINLVGLSYGGWLAAEYAVRFPDRVRSLIMIAPGATILPLSRQFILRSILLSTGNLSLARTTVRWLFSDLHREDPARLEVLLHRLQVAFECRSARGTIRPTVLDDSELRTLPPALFLVGENERIYSARKAIERLHRVAPRIQTEIIPGAGHDVTYVRAEAVSQRILKFLSEVN